MLARNVVRTSLRASSASLTRSLAPRAAVVSIPAQYAFNSTWANVKAGPPDPILGQSLTSHKARYFGLHLLTSISRSLISQQV